tara:strand:+ start:159 stop:386 length:228 start_codon:yes stop_codon:yes gene_type:complete
MIKYLLIFILASLLLLTGCVSNQVSCVMEQDKDGNEYILHGKHCKSPWWEHAVTLEQREFWELNGEDINKRKYSK